MLTDMTRARVIQIWFAAVALAVIAGFALGVSVTVGTGILLAAACLVPPAILLMLWPEARSRTASDVLHDTDSRG